MRQGLIILLLAMLGVRAVAQDAEHGLVKWLSFKEAQELNKKQPKPFLVDVYTDWCGWCKHMMKTTYSNPNMAAYINAYFYPVKFNAETKDTIEYNGAKYGPVNLQPKTPHQLALKFLGSNLSYPSTVFITNNFEFNLLSQGYLEERKLEPLLVFTVENVFRTTSFEDFRNNFEHTFYDTTYTKGDVKVYSMEEALKLQAKKPKKLLVNVYAGFCNSCKVMTRTSFSDTAVAKYINDHFYLVNFDAERNDTISFKNEKYSKSLVNGYPLHTLALKLTNNRLVLPSLAVIDEQGNTIDAINYYLSPSSLKPILQFYGEDKFKKMSWPDFMKQYTEKPEKTSPGKTKKS